MDAELYQIGDNAMLAQYGPMRLSIQAWDQDGPALALAAKAGEYSFSILPRIPNARELFRRGNIPTGPLGDPLLEKMRDAASMAGQPDLGPMAAVAGAIAEEVALWLNEAGASKAIVENGGDIAVYLKEAESVNVGVHTSLYSPEPKYSLKLSGRVASLWGVASSSGLGGRGLSRGLADAAMCVAASPAVADACATALSNACDVDSPAVERALAEEISPGTDIPGLLVTTAIGPLTDEEIPTALNSAAAYAQNLVDRGVILGAFISLRGAVRLSENFADKVAPLVKL